jgi:hypothetical protein
VLWLPPTLDQLTEDPGNYRILLDHFGSPPEEPIGVRRAGTEVMEHFDLGHLVVDQLREPGLLARGELGRFSPLITCLSGLDHDAEMTRTWYIYEQGKGANSGSGAQMLGVLLLDFS